MIASAKEHGRSLWLGLAAAALALTVWGATLLATPHTAGSLSQQPVAVRQMGGPGGGSGTGG